MALVVKQGLVVKKTGPDRQVKGGVDIEEALLQGRLREQVWKGLNPRSHYWLCLTVPRCDGVYGLIPCARSRPLACQVLHSCGRAEGTKHKLKYLGAEQGETQSHLLFPLCTNL